MLHAAALVSLAWGGLELDATEPIVTLAAVEKHNSNPHRTWDAHVSPRFKGVSRARFAAMQGATGRGPEPPTADAPLSSLGPAEPGIRRVLAAGLPESFDSRERWSWCPTIGALRDQGDCGSCWAHAPTESLMDRFCTVANVTVDLSVGDVAGCCDWNGSPSHPDPCIQFGPGQGCKGGRPRRIEHSAAVHAAASRASPDPRPLSVSQATLGMRCTTSTPPASCPLRACLTTKATTSASPRRRRRGPGR